MTNRKQMRRRYASTTALLGTLILPFDSSHGSLLSNQGYVGLRLLDTRCTFPSTILRARSNHQSSNGSTDEAPPPPPARRHPKTPQIRKQHSQRRPPNYWKNIDNIDRELRELWAWQNVTIPHNIPVPIPNETLLNYWKRHDLRAAIATHGGRDFLADSLGGSDILPGRWKSAVQTTVVQTVIAQDPNLCLDLPPLAPQQLRSKCCDQPSVSSKISSSSSQPSSSSKSEQHQSSKRTPDERKDRWRHREWRKPHGYWSSSKLVIQELYKYLEERRQEENIPEVWMPRLSALRQAGRADIISAVHRFGGQSRICRLAGLVPFREWNYVEGMHELLLRLKDYLDQYHDGDYHHFPAAARVKDQGYDRLYALIQYYGGVKFVAARLGMEWSAGGGASSKRRRRHRGERELLSAGMNWGPFDLEFGIELYAFIREQELNRKPPLHRPETMIPSQLTLLKHGEVGMRLDKKIREYGGYENVARRMGLGYSFHV